MLRDEARHRGMCVGGARCRQTAVQYGVGSGSAGNTWSGVEEFTVRRRDRGAECWCSLLCVHCFGSSGGVNRFLPNDATNEQQPIFFKKSVQVRVLLQRGKVDSINTQLEMNT